HEVTILIGEPLSGDVSAERLQQRVLELGAEAAEFRKRPASTLAHRFIRAAKQHWTAFAVVDSTGKNLSFGRTLSAALLLKKWIRRNCKQAQCVGLLLPSSVGGAVANLGVTLAGKTAVNLNFTAGEQAIAYAVKTCRISTILTSRVFFEKAKMPQLPGMIYLEDLLGSFKTPDKVSALAPARLLPTRILAAGVAPDDVAAVVFSSGSTGTP